MHTNFMDSNQMNCKRISRTFLYLDKTVQGVMRFDSLHKTNKQTVLGTLTNRFRHKQKMFIKSFGEPLISPDTDLLRDLCVISLIARHNDDVSMLWFMNFSKSAFLAARTWFVTSFLCLLSSSNLFSFF